MQASKILLSEEEIRWAENSEFILTKNRIIKKIISLFALLSDEYREIADEKRKLLPEEFYLLSPKISRGEQYLGLPYVILDYPRIFAKDNVFAIRTFFWWGNYFSLTLHLKGEYKNAFEEKIKKNLQLLSKNDYWIAVSDDEWRHDFEEENYVPLNSGGVAVLNENIQQKAFLKLAVRWPLQNGNEIEPLYKEQFSTLLNVITG
ncbi:MAG TPA: hypothetical protein VEV87_08575 [Chitinophagaceae bacterium]|nr:hypothetical protein [Chitinophagaceae bacterium]